MGGIKIALVGAGSRSFGPSTVRDIMLSDALHRREVTVVAMDVAADALVDITAYAHHLKEKLGRSTKIVSTTDLAEALDGTNFVVTAIEIKRELYWTMDFHVPRKHGFRQVFGENGGPGGLFHALRNMKPTVHIAREMEKRCPDAWMLNFTNPEHKLCEAVSRLTSIKNAGLCHGVFMGQSQIAHILGRPMDELDMAACGINHFTWFTHIRDKKTGEDLYPQLRAAEREGDWLHDWHELAMARVLFRRFGLWPSPAPNHYGEYVRWAEEFVADEMQYYYDPADGQPWETGDVPEFVYSLSHHPSKRPWRKPAPEPWRMEDAELRPSGELDVPIMEGIALDERRDLDAFNVPNRGAIPNLPDDAVVEVPGWADGGGLHNCPMPELPEAIAAMLRMQCSINQLLVEAFAEGSRDKLLQAFLLDPTVDSYRRAVECVDEMLRLQKDILPEIR